MFYTMYEQWFFVYIFVKSHVKQFVDTDKVTKDLAVMRSFTQLLFPLKIEMCFKTLLAFKLLLDSSRNERIITITTVMQIIAAWSFHCDNTLNSSAKKSTYHYSIILIIYQVCNMPLLFLVLCAKKYKQI